MNRVVIDTNVFVAAATAPMGFCATLMLKRSAGAFETIVSPRLLEELQRTQTSPKFAKLVRQEDAAAFVAYIERTSIVLPDVDDPLNVCRDPSDDFLFALATSSDAIALVTGDKDVLEVSGTSLRILTPRAFLEVLA